jgi:hypothetical protein
MTTQDVADTSAVTFCLHSEPDRANCGIHDCYNTLYTFYLNSMQGVSNMVEAILFEFSVMMPPYVLVYESG